jgi:hypothetical protein
MRNGDVAETEHRASLRNIVDLKVSGRLAVVNPFRAFFFRPTSSLRLSGHGIWLRAVM